jgi:hypothetical protein
MEVQVGVQVDSALAPWRMEARVARSTDGEDGATGACGLGACGPAG